MSSDDVLMSTKVYYHQYHGEIMVRVFVCEVPWFKSRPVRRWSISLIAYSHMEFCIILILNK